MTFLSRKNKKMTSLLRKYAVLTACGVSGMLIVAFIFLYVRKITNEKEWRYNQERVAYGIECLVSIPSQSFPPAARLDENGQPMHSWRVLLLPYMGGSPFYRVYYKRNEPWNGPNNQRFLREFIVKHEGEEPYDLTSGREVYQLPELSDSPDNFTTNLVMVIEKKPQPCVNREGQCWLHAGDDMMFVTLEHSDIHWMEPRDLSLDELSFLNDESAEPNASRPPIIGSFVVSETGRAEYLDEEETWKRLRQMVKDRKVED